MGFLGILTIASMCFMHITALEMGGILSGNRQGSAPLGIALGDGDLDVEGVCRRAGPACLNCTHAVTCIALPFGWLRVPLQACEAEGGSCNARLGGCSQLPAPECHLDAQQFDHVCEQVGIFPDAKDCRKFHMCSPPAGAPHGRPADHHVALCPRHYAYDALTAQCRNKLEYGQCESNPVPECVHIGQSGPLADSPNHYYVCLEKQGRLHPQVFVCPFGYYYYNNFCNAQPPANSVDTNYGKPNVATQPSVEEVAASVTTTEPPSVAETTTIEVRAAAYSTDNFLADKFDLSNYGPVLDETPAQNSFEYSGISEESY